MFTAFQGQMLLEDRGSLGRVAVYTGAVVVFVIVEHDTGSRAVLV